MVLEGDCSSIGEEGSATYNALVSNLASSIGDTYAVDRARVFVTSVNCASILVSLYIIDTEQTSETTGASIFLQMQNGADANTLVLGGYTVIEVNANYPPSTPPQPPPRDLPSPPLPAPALAAPPLDDADSSLDLSEDDEDLVQGTLIAAIVASVVACVCCFGLCILYFKRCMGRCCKGLSKTPVNAIAPMPPKAEAAPVPLPIAIDVAALTLAAPTETAPLAVSASPSLSAPPGRFGCRTLATITELGSRNSTSCNHPDESFSLAAQHKPARTAPKLPPVYKLQTVMPPHVDGNAADGYAADGDASSRCKLVAGHDPVALLEPAESLPAALLPHLPLGCLVPEPARAQSPATPSEIDVDVGFTSAGITFTPGGSPVPILRPAPLGRRDLLLPAEIPVDSSLYRPPPTLPERSTLRESSLMDVHTICSQAEKRSRARPPPPALAATVVQKLTSRIEWNRSRRGGPGDVSKPLRRVPHLGASSPSGLPDGILSEGRNVSEPSRPAPQPGSSSPPSLPDKALRDRLLSEPSRPAPQLESGSPLGLSDGALSEVRRPPSPPVVGGKRMGEAPSRETGRMPGVPHREQPRPSRPAPHVTLMRPPSSREGPVPAARRPPPQLHLTDHEVDTYTTASTSIP